jgi:hypothetical protein
MVVVERPGDTSAGIHHEGVPRAGPLGLSAHPDLPGVPLAIELARSQGQRQMFKLVFARQVMGRLFLAPPGVPADRLAALRKAFCETVADPEFKAEAARLRLEITPVSGEQVQNPVSGIRAQPAEIARRTGEALR